MIELTPEEEEYVVTVLRSAHTELLHNLHHADSRDFRQALRSVIEMNERITGKVAQVPALAGSDWKQQPAEH